MTSLHLSKPGVCFPTQRVDNSEIIARVRANFRGDEAEWPALESGIRRVFHLCNTQQRYLECDPEARVADYAVKAAHQCLEVNDTSLDEVDLVICGGIARQYFEPATAMEVAAKLGLKRTHAFDVTSACVGHLEAVQAAAAYLKLHPRYRTALVCTAELCGDFLDYDIQTVKELHSKTAGLTIGNAAACMLLRSEPWPGGGVRVVTTDTFTAPDHWHLCQVPIRGKLTSSSVELMRLGKYIPPRLREILGRIDWDPTEIDHFVFHQPSEVMVRTISQELGGDPARGVYVHHQYGNTASASVGVAFHELLRARTLVAGQKLLLGSAAAGFAVVVVAGQWTG